MQQRHAKRWSMISRNASSTTKDFGIHLRAMITPPLMLRFNAELFLFPGKAFFSFFCQPSSRNALDKWLFSRVFLQLSSRDAFIWIWRASTRIWRQPIKFGEKVHAAAEAEDDRFGFLGTHASKTRSRIGSVSFSSSRYVTKGRQHSWFNCLSMTGIIDAPGPLLPLFIHPSLELIVLGRDEEKIQLGCGRGY